jgi:protein-S-isoprenylcysteine O-methyltransferase Ste14
LGTLGRSFAVLPAVRKLVICGPYRYLRHPAYAGEVVLLLACALASENSWSWFLLALGILLMAVRIQAEEETLEALEGYQRYRQEVPFRLLPGLW